MPGTREGALKAAKTRREKYGPEWERQKNSNAGKHNKHGGFASEKIGTDGLTGVERAKKYSRKAKDENSEI